MTEISKQSSLSKRRIRKIDETIETISKTLEKISGVHKLQLECSLLTAKLKREKLKALEAAANSQVILSEMDILIAETDLYMDLQRLKKSKKLKLVQDENTVPLSSSQSTPVSMNSNSMSQDEPNNNKRKKKKKSQSSRNCGRSSDETVVIGKLRDTKSISGCSESFFNSALSNNSNLTTDSDLFITSSVQAEFNNPYTTTSRQTPDLQPTNTINTKQTADMKGKTKASVEKNSNSIHTEKQQYPLPKITNVVSESTLANKNNCGASNYLKRRLESDNSSNAPIRHNLPKVISKPKCTGGLTQTISKSQSQTQYRTLNTSANMYQSSMSLDSPGIGSIISWKTSTVEQRPPP